MNRIYLTKLFIIASIVLVCNFAVRAQTTSFTTAGGPFTYTVPAGVSAVGIDMAGAQGGASLSSAGGKGGRAQGNLAVTPGQVLNVYVGGVGLVYTYCILRAGGVNGGGNGYGYGGSGGGASDVRVGGTALGNRVMVAGGAGGSGYNCGTTNGETGGDGGGTTGGVGMQCSSANPTYGGSGGTQTAGGVGATGYGQPAGGLGVGGNASGSYCYAGGGGGGYYGGGAGAYGGGGGGSSYIAGPGVTGATTTSAYQSGNGYVTICAPSVGNIIGNLPVCVGSIRTLSSTGGGGTWSTANSSVASIDATTGAMTGVSAGTTTITYSVVTTTCGAGFVTTTVTVNPLPAAIAGASSLCVGNTTTLSNPGVGTWSSSSATTASIDPSTGLVTGLSSGTANMSFTLTSTGCFVTQPMTINSLPASIVGASNVCAGGATTVMSDPTPGGSWTSSNAAVASITAGSGIVTGGAAGSATLTYTLPTSCFVVSTISVNPLPSPITGSTSVCVGASTSLSDVGGGSWSSSNVSVASIGPSGVTSGVGAGSATITYTLPSGCATTTSIIVNAAPAPITGVLSICNGNTTALASATPGGTWTSNNLSIATVVPSSGVVNSVTSGIPVISYTLPTTCFTTVAVTINALPTAFSITGGGGYCTGSGGVHIGLGLSTTGVNYKLFNSGTLVATVGGSNAALDFGVYTAAGTYTAIGINTTTACTNGMSGSTTITINPLPNAFNVTGGGSFCPGGAGVHIMQSGSEPGMNYQLYTGGTSVGGYVVGTGSPLDFGAQTIPGTYTVLATDGITGCSKVMSGSAAVALNATPPVHTLSTGGDYCTGGAGISISLDGSDASTSYQLFYGSSTSGAAMAGTGSAVNFGLRTGAGTYSVVATNNVTGCTSNMAGVATININPLPLVFFVTGGGGFCPGGSGVHVNLNYSTTGVNYQLYRGSSSVGSLVAGSNAGLDFGLQVIGGSYSVVAIDAATGCTKNMSGSANVFVNPLPANHNLTGGGNFCVGGTGVHVGLDGTNVGAGYQLLFNGTPIGTPVSGTGGPIDFGAKTGVGTYTVMATNATTSCSSIMPGSVSIAVNPLPNAETVVGAGTSFCAGGTGIDVTLTGSAVGINYQLFRGGAAVGTPMAGTGLGLDFGLRTVAGSYTVVGTDATTGCQATMTGSANISINPAPAAYVITGGGSYCQGAAGVHVGLSGTTLGVNYQLSNGGGTVGVAFPGTGSPIDFGFQAAAGVYSVVATDAITGCTSNMAGAPVVNINPLPLAFTVTGGGAYCAGGTGVHVYLSGTTSGKRYQLYNGSSPSGLYVTGLGSSIDFGVRTAGTYTAVATDPSTSCSIAMVGSASISANPLPNAQVVTGGGAYCAGGAGMDISLAGSDAGISYQLLRGGSPIGAAFAGTGSAIDFGIMTAAGNYTVVANDTLSLCNNNMSGSATISITPQPTVYPVTGGGAYCAGGAGSSVGLSNTNSGIVYQLMQGGLAVGSAVTGTGGPISFGSLTGSGTYNVVASPGGLCQTNMSGSATVNISPLPTAYTVTGGGSYCANDTGLVVSLSGSNTGIHYQLYQGTSLSGAFVNGTGSAINFGTHSSSGIYTVIATNALTGCTSNMTGSTTVTVKPAPQAFNVAGGGAFCNGGAGVAVILANSNTNVNYQLKQGGTNVGTAVPGTGTAITFGLQTAPGTYTVVGTDATNLCATNMNDTATVSVNPIVTPVVSIAVHPGLTIKMGQSDTLVATVTNGGTSGPTYQWKINRFPISGATTNTFVSNQFANNDTVSCEATSTGDCGNVTTAKYVVLTVINTVGVAPVAGIVSDIKVVPNPNKGVFTVAGNMGTSADEEVSIDVLDILGHVVYSEKVMTQNGIINSRVQLNGTLANGMYLLNLRSNTANQVFHVVIEQ